jgi:tRNA (guanine9-N1)-methyltransferase
MALLLSVAPSAATARIPRVAIELSFGGAMNDRERKSLSHQLIRAYGANRRAASPLQLTFSGLAEAERHPDMLPADGSLFRWEAAQRIAERAEDYWPADSLVWLSPDAAEPLMQLSSVETYVVCGLVDRSVATGSSLERSRMAGGGCRRLPLREYAPRSDVHPILSVVSVIEILAAVNSGRSWSEAIGSSLPKRYTRRREMEEARRELAKCDVDAALSTRSARDAWQTTNYE